MRIEDWQPTGNEPGSAGEPKGKVSSPTLERVEDQTPNMTASITFPEIQTLEHSSTNVRKLVLYKDREL